MKMLRVYLRAIRIARHHRLWRRHTEQPKSPPDRRPQSPPSASLVCLPSVLLSLTAILVTAGTIYAAEEVLAVGESITILFPYIERHFSTRASPIG